MFCYFINACMDVLALTREKDFSKYKTEINHIYGEIVDCKESFIKILVYFLLSCNLDREFDLKHNQNPENHYSGQRLDLIIEASGVCLHILLLLLALRARKAVIHERLFAYAPVIKV